MSITIQEVKDARLLRKFIRFPIQLYENNPYYVPSLNPDEVNTLHWDKNPAFEYCRARYWLAFKENAVVGRVAAIINQKFIDKWDQPYLRFGWLDFVDDAAVAAALMERVEDWARENHLSAVHGPLGFTDLDREGMLIDGFDELATMATLYNFPYYPEYIERLDYEKDVDWVEFELNVPQILDPKIEKAAKIVLKRYDLHMLDVQHKRDLLAYAPQLFQLINREYSGLYGSTPLSEHEIQHYTKTYFNFVHPDFVPIILDDRDQMVAFGVTIPSLSKALQKSKGRLFPFGWYYLLRALTKNTRADLYLIAVKKKYRGLGVNMVLMNHVYQVFNERGIEVVETNPELETNLDVQGQWKSIEKRQHKRRRCYIKYL